jgi:hypothetical protein
MIRSKQQKKKYFVDPCSDFSFFYSCDKLGIEKKGGRGVEGILAV